MLPFNIIAAEVATVLFPDPAAPCTHKTAHYLILPKP